MKPAKAPVPGNNEDEEVVSVGTSRMEVLKVFINNSRTHSLVFLLCEMWRGMATREGWNWPAKEWGPGGKGRSAWQE